MILVHPFYRNGKEKRQFGELKFGEKLSFGNEENRKEKVTFLSLLLKDSTYLY